MKRRAALLKLSRDHHTALVLTLRISQANGEAEVSSLMESLPRLFQHELDPHFRVEEEVLLPRLEKAGEIALVRQTFEDHKELRNLVARIALGDLAILKTFGAKLNAHVRFEERELFPRAEAVLPASFLDMPT